MATAGGGQRGPPSPRELVDAASMEPAPPAAPPLLRRRSDRPFRRVSLAPASPPRLRLEVLTAGQLHSVLYLTYGAVAFAAMLAVFEHHAPYIYDTQSLQAERCNPPVIGLSGDLAWDFGWREPPPPGAASSANLTAAAVGGAPAPIRTVCVSANRSWSVPPVTPYLNASVSVLSIRLNHSNRFFKLEAQLLGRQQPLPAAVSLPLQLVGNISGDIASHNGGIAPPEHETGLAANFTSVDNFSRALLLNCPAGGRSCAPLPLYQTDMVGYERYRLNLTLNVRAGALASVSLPMSPSKHRLVCLSLNPGAVDHVHV